MSARVLAVEPLTRAAFARFGDVISRAEQSPHRRLLREIAADRMSAGWWVEANGDRDGAGDAGNRSERCDSLQSSP